MIQFFGIQSKTVFAVQTNSTLNQNTISKLSWLFSDMPLIQKEIINGDYIGPKANMLTPWSTNAVEILQNMGVYSIIRIEKYFLTNKKIVFDPMLQEKFTKLDQNIFKLNIITLKTAKCYLSKGNGSFIIKTFQNSLLKKLRIEMEKSFHLVQTYKPAASKSKSGEIYLYGEKPL